MNSFASSLAVRGAGGSVQMGDRFRFSFPQPTLPAPVNKHVAEAQRPIDQFRPIFVKTGVVSQASGSAYVELENTKVICGVYGPRPSTSGREFSDKAMVTCEFKYATWSDVNTRRGYQKDEEEREQGIAILHALEVAVIREAYPKSSIDINIVVLQDDGGAVAAAITCASLALANAGVQMYNIVSACTIGYSSSKNKLLLDPDRSQSGELQGQLTLAVMGPSQVTQFIQSGTLSTEQLTEAIDLATAGCIKLQDLLSKHLVESVSSTSLKKSRAIL